ncbi:CsgG/HfaB family protein [Viridibacterium curvum]|uniref:Peptidoglycan-binding protein n=1 Tax=Viridibacterium curvum TaxID=1101404 RepID=A0ABP9QCE1_9RHOO
MNTIAQSSIRRLSILACALAPLMFTACSSQPKLGGSGTVASGGAAGSTASGENSQLEKCTESLGTISLVENQQAGWYSILTNQYKLPPTANLLRLMIQQSNCFVVVERSAAGLRAMERERNLDRSGELRQGSNFGRGQMVSSDYALSPEVLFSESDTGGVGGVVGGVIGGTAGRLISVVGANAKNREAGTMLTLVDNRSGVQIAASEGSASKVDFGGFGALLGSRAGGAAGGYTNTPQGKIIAAAFMDSYNQMVRSLRNYKAQEVKGGLGKGGRLKVGD